MKLREPTNDVIKQANYNYLMETKSKDNNVFIVETPPGIGSIYNLNQIHGNLASVVLAIDSVDDLNYANSGNFETAIVDINHRCNIEDKDIIDKIKSSGFSRIIIVKTILK